MARRQKRKPRKNKPRAVHFAKKGSVYAKETACGKSFSSLSQDHFSEYGHRTTDPSGVTCKHCLDVLAAEGRDD